MGLSELLFNFVFSRLFPYENEGIQLKLTTKKGKRRIITLLPTSKEVLEQLSSKSIVYNKKKIVLANIVNAEIVTPLDYDIAEKLVTVKDLFTEKVFTPSNVTHVEKGEKIYWITYDGQYYLGKSLQDIRNVTTHIWDGGAFDDNLETRYNCLFFANGSLRAKSFKPKTGILNTPYPLVPDDGQVLWIGKEGIVEIIFKNGTNKIVDFDKDHIVKNSAANGKALTGKIACDFDNYDFLKLMETKTKVKPNKNRKKNGDIKKSAIKKAVKSVSKNIALRSR